MQLLNPILIPSKIEEIGSPRKRVDPKILYLGVGRKCPTLEKMEKIALPTFLGRTKFCIIFAFLIIVKN